jgi:hypothetical protein
MEPIWGPIDELLHLQTRYAGEIPRRGFLQRLGEGRRVVFTLLMVGSLVGGFMGFNIRRAAGMGPVFLLLFVGVVIYTYFSWRAEDRAVFETELGRLREALSMDFSRLLSEVLRERQNRLQAAIEDVRRDVGVSIDAAQREAAAGAAAAGEQERRASRTRLRVVEQRLREVQAMGHALARTRQGLDRLHAEAARALAAAARPA